MYLSIVIKTLNEERHIARAIETALAAAREAGASFEIIVADSLSSDATVEIARRYPVCVVQLTDAAHRGCGAGVQLGYQHSRGKFIYFLDGDMQLVPGFMSRACRLLEMNQDLGGVAGFLRDTRIRNAVDRIRVTNGETLRAGPVPWLGGGGLYRREAIEEAGGYAADRNLKAFEEADLGMRLRAAGWRLERLDQDAVLHTGHDMDTWALLMKHWKSRRAMSSGVLLRQSFGRPWMWDALSLLKHPIGVIGTWCVLLFSVALLSPKLRVIFLVGFVIAAAGSIGALAIRKRSLYHAGASIFGWHYAAAAIVTGLPTPCVPPTSPLPSRVLHDARGDHAPVQAP